MGDSVEGFDGSGASWEKEYRELEGAIKMRNYSGKTHDAHRMWVRKFQGFVRSKSPEQFDGKCVKQFLTDLAVRQGVAGSTQSQAFNALLFFYRHVLRREFGKLDGVVRAKRRPYVPVVLSRAEVDAVIAEIKPPVKMRTADDSAIAGARGCEADDDLCADGAGHPAQEGKKSFGSRDVRSC